MPQISPHAIVENPSNLAEDVIVGPFSYIGRNVRIGRGTRIDNNASLDGDVEIGCDNHIYPFAVIGQPPGVEPADGKVIIGNRNNIREHAVIYGGKVTRIGDDNLIMTACYVGPGATIEDQVILGNYTQLAADSRVEKYVRTSGFTGTRTGVTIGAYTFTSGYAGIDRDAPPFAMLQGYPFKVRGVNTHNLKRCGFSEEAIDALRHAFRNLFDPDSPEVCEEKLKEISGRPNLDPSLQYLVDFLRRNGHVHEAKPAKAHKQSAKGG